MQLTPVLAYVHACKSVLQARSYDKKLHQTLNELHIIGEYNFLPEYSRVGVGALHNGLDAIVVNPIFLALLRLRLS